MASSPSLHVIHYAARIIVIASKEVKNTSHLSDCSMYLSAMISTRESPAPPHFCVTLPKFSPFNAQRSTSIFPILLAFKIHANSFTSIL